MKYCNDYGDNPQCLGTVDLQYTMDFTDIEPGAYIYWCAHCGPIARSMQEAINRASPEKIQKLREVMETEIKKQTVH